MRSPSQWIIGALVFAVVLAARVTVLGDDGRETRESGQSELELLGPLTREQVESSVPSWIEQQVLAAPDLETTSDLISSLADIEIQIFFGTWCSDSERELSRLWRAFDDLGIVDTPGIVYIGVDRSKTEPEALLEGLNLLYVPTFVVRRDGEELGRIVEESPDGIEVDLLAIVEGRKSGLVTAKSELLDLSSPERP